MHYNSTRRDGWYKDAVLARLIHFLNVLVLFTHDKPFPF